MTGACHPPPAPPVAPTIDLARAWGAWRTLSAEHRVTVEAQDEHGLLHRESLRGLIAVERPDRFRLRALGPAGITLFDLLFRDHVLTVLRSLRDPHGEALSRLFVSITADLAVAFELLPQPAGHVRWRVDGGRLIAEEPDRTITLSDFRGEGAKVAPSRLSIDNRALRYKVEISAHGTLLDEPLDPALFRGDQDTRTTE
jgi:hypothetical protein